MDDYKRVRSGMQLRDARRLLLIKEENWCRGKGRVLAFREMGSFLHEQWFKRPKAWEL